MLASAEISPGLSAARARSEAGDRAVGDQTANIRAGFVGQVALVALGAYGRRELTPRADVDLLFLHSGGLSTRWATEAVCYPLWEQHLRVEPNVRTLAECAAEVRRSLAMAVSLLDARFVSGDETLFVELARTVVEPLRRDKEHLRQRLRPEVQRRHAAHPAATSSTVPDIVAGRGGLRDAALLRWLEPAAGEQLDCARDLLLAVVSVVEDSLGHTQHRLSARLQERVADALGYADATALMAALYAHTRWVAFSIDGAFGRRRGERPLGAHFELRRGELVADSLPPVEDAPALGLRLANLVGFAPPATPLLEWASTDGGPLPWDEAAREQLWLLLRAADWRAWEFLDITGLLVRYLPELSTVWRRAPSPTSNNLALDSHSFLALRRLHEWLDSADPFAERVWRGVRQRDLVYLAVLLHELEGEAARRAAERLDLPQDWSASIAFAAGNFGLLRHTASQRDLHDEELLLELASRIGTPQRLRVLLLVTAAHELAAGEAGWSPWQADLLRHLFTRLETLVRQPREVGARRTRSLEQHRQRLTAQLERRGLQSVLPLVNRLPRRYILAHSAAFIARHLRLVGDRPVADGEVRLEAHRPRKREMWEVLIVARDRPGLLATFAGVLALRGATVLAADAATSADGLVLDVFTVTSAYGLPLERGLWQHVESDLRAALQGKVPLDDLLGARPVEGERDAHVQVQIDNAASQFFSIVEVRAPDQVGLLYRIASGLLALGLDIHHAKITTSSEGALDVFYVWDMTGQKLDEERARGAQQALWERLSP